VLQELVNWVSGSRNSTPTLSLMQSPKRIEPVTPVPDQTRDRWGNRAEPASGTGAIYWHILFRDDPAVRATARKAQARLAPFRDLHMTPEQWLHATALVAGTTDDISSEGLDAMLADARQRLSRVQPISVTISRVLYHPEAIMLGFAPEGALDPIHHAVRQSTLAATGRTGGVTGSAGRWIPHMTICYSTGIQPMAPIAAALGHDVPRCDITVRAVSLVIQWGPERLWNWQPVGAASRGNTLRPAGPSFAQAIGSWSV
jgi:2'-5' RNA ligase